MFKKLFNFGNIKILIDAISKSEKISILGVGKGEKLAIVNSIGKFFVWIAVNEIEAKEISELFTDCGIKNSVLTKNFSLDLNIRDNTFNEYCSIIKSVKNGDLDALVITPNVLATKFPKLEDTSSLIIENNKQIDFNNFIKNLIEFGYTRNEVVSEKGEFSVKGDIVDIFLPNKEMPYRISFNFDEVESIKKIDISTMLSIEMVDSLSISKINALDIDIKQLSVDLAKIKSNNTKTKEFKNKALELVETKEFKNYYWFAPFKEVCFFCENLLQNAILCFSDAKMVYDALENYINEQASLITGLIKDGQLLEKHKALKSDIKEVLNFNKNLCLIAFQNISNNNRLFLPNKVFNFKILSSSLYIDNTSLLNLDLQNALRQGYTIVLYCKSNEGVNRIASKINKSIPINISQTLSLIHLKEINLLPRFYPLGFSLANEKLLIIGTNQLFGVVKKSQEQINVFGDAFLPEAGEFVVHQSHGIGKCLGIQSLNFSNALRDYVVVEYKNADKLYLPVENIDSLSKYVGSDKAPTLNKLGGTEFETTKKKISSSLKTMAFDLLELYAKREKTKGFTYPKDDDLQKAFEDSFGFEATTDQLKAVEEIKSDMENGKLMDRLICGDVGFGKTEVALRCAFKTICAGKKVELLCPTTILSEQHYNTALVRMKNFGVRVEVLNRFKTDAQVKQILKDLEDGKIDMLVGTHKILGKKVRVPNLGLLILDEEQKFGVEDKEKIKNLKQNINVLTLSATPIPRTLHISMVGIRDMSIIETPPVSRHQTVVQICEYSDFLIKNAIERELARDGQVLIVYNRVESIYNILSKIKCLVNSSVRFGVAHGQMEEKELENVIYNLYNKNIDVLIATSLIENGVDLPNANTLIVLDADNLGLSQLYQLKGRIGRSDRQAYAYFTYNGGKILSENAYKRLQAINEFTSMGSGFKIALRDLEIRGAGNILGKEQHGHMAKVGYAMYVTLLKQAVAEVKGEIVERRGEVKIETNIDAYIPNDYIKNYHNRLAMYIEISHIETINGINEQLCKFENLFGTVPLEVVSLCKIAYIKNMASKLNIQKVVIKNTECYLQFITNNDVLNSKTSEICSKFSKIAVLKLEHLPIINLNMNCSLKEKLDTIITFLESFFI